MKKEKSRGKYETEGKKDQEKTETMKENNKYESLGKE